MSRKLLFSGRLQRRTAEPTMDDLAEQSDGYVGRHIDERPKDWQPAHTKAAARRRAQIAHGRPDDRRIEKTRPISMDRLREILAGGAR